jgi:transposase
LINKGKAAAYKRQPAEIWLKGDITSEGDAWNEVQISQAFEVSISTIERVRQRLVEEGLEAAWNRAKQTKSRNN